MDVEQIFINEELPNKFEAKKSFRYVVVSEIELFESFRVKSFKLKMSRLHATISVSCHCLLEDKNFDSKLHDALLNQLVDTITCKYLTGGGQVSQTILIQGATLQDVEYDQLSYSDQGNQCVSLQFKTCAANVTFE